MLIPASHGFWGGKGGADCTTGIERRNQSVKGHARASRWASPWTFRHVDVPRAEVASLTAPGLFCPVSN